MLNLVLSDPHTKDEAFGIIRTLVDAVRLIPEAGQLRVELLGALAGILMLSRNDNSHLRCGGDDLDHIRGQADNDVGQMLWWCDYRIAALTRDVGIIPYSCVATAQALGVAARRDAELPRIFAAELGRTLIPYCVGRASGVFLGDQ